MGALGATEVVVMLLVIATVLFLFFGLPWWAVSRSMTSGLLPDHGASLLLVLLGWYVFPLLGVLAIIRTVRQRRAVAA